jgi:tryptophan synthase alpha chain
MSRIAGCFDRLRGEGRKALIPFITAGDPDRSVTVPLMHALVEAGADLIELGVPFSDPMADGPVIQRASERALAKGVTLGDVLGMVWEFRRLDAETPIVLMGYLNPVEAMGYEPFAAVAAEAGVDGALTVDLPPEEADDLVESLRRHALDPIFLLAPTSPPNRVRLICDHASGFIYYVSLKGVTGANRLDVEEVGRRLESIRACTRLPLGVGFGIRDPDSAAAVARVSDAVVVGSALVARIEDLLATPERIPAEVSGLLAGMRRAMDTL